jgi:fused signal recognition particle receptor
MDPILYVVLALVAIGGVIAWVVTSRRGALPPAAEPAQLPPVRARGEPDGDTDAGDELEPDTIVGEDLAEAVAEPVASELQREPEAGAEAAPRPSRARTFTPPPRPGAQAQPAVTVPLPIEKPRAATAKDLARAPADDAARFREGLAKTRGGFVDKLARLFRGKPKVDAALRDKVEEVLFTADIGTTTANKLLERVTETLDKKEVADPDAVWAVIRQACLEILAIDAPPPRYDVTPGPYVLLAIGVNGVGKTTTLGKLAARHVAEGRKVLLVAGDTFRAAAVEQLDVWARRVGCELHKGAPKADPSSVIYEGIARGRREGFDVVLCDTAGRLHTKKELMDELAKVGRAAGKALAAGTGQAAAPEAGAHDIFLVLDATIGQNALAQAQMFKETMRFTGLVVTKLDGTAKGGVVLGICDELRIPIRYVGIGEGIGDLREFSPEAFTTALLDA